MKTKAFIIIIILGVIAITMISCAQDDTPFDDADQLPSAPVLHHIVDSIYTPFFTSGNDTLKGYISWGNEKGTLSIMAPNSVQLKNEEPYVLFWDQNLVEGSYPIIVSAENSKGIAKDRFVLVSRFGGNFIGTYNYQSYPVDVMSIGRPFYFDPNGAFGYDDPWDYGNSMEGHWSWTSNNEIQGSYRKHGQIGDYLLKATVVYDKDTGLPVLSGHWNEQAGTGSGIEKGKISFTFDQDSEFTTAYNKENHAWDIGSNNQYYPQIADYWDSEDPDKFGGWFIATCKDGPDQKSYRLYLGIDKRIFRGKKNENDTWTWASDKQIQGTFMEHSDFVEGMEVGDIEIYWERRY